MATFILQFIVFMPFLENEMTSEFSVKLIINVYWLNS